MITYVENSRALRSRALPDYNFVKMHQGLADALSYAKTASAFTYEKILPRF